MKKEDLFDSIALGVVTGSDVHLLYKIAKTHQCAIPAVNVSNSSTLNAALDAANKTKMPIVIQFSGGGAAAFIGKGIGLSAIDASIQGAIAGANYVHQVAEAYGVRVILHTDHANRKLLPWVDGLLAAGKRHFANTGKPLFSSHMIDLSEESLEENIDTCAQYLQKLHALDMSLEIELGCTGGEEGGADNTCASILLKWHYLCTGGEEDGVDNTHLDNRALYTQPEDVAYAYQRLVAISPLFTIAASFGNVHGVYKPGNVELTPVILKHSQDLVTTQFSLAPNSLNFVFHGGSGSTAEEISEAISYGVVKMNIDTDTDTDTDAQWAFWQGVSKFNKKFDSDLKSQIGNPEGDDKPNKKYYDPRQWSYAGESSMTDRLIQAYRDLQCI